MSEASESNPIRVLYVDDSRLDRELVRESLSDDRKIEIVEASTRDEFISHLSERRFDVVLSDFNILGYDGLQVIRSVQQALPGVPVIIVTGTGSEVIAVDAMKLGAADYVIKNPQHIRRLPLTIRTVLEQTRLRLERETAQIQLDRFFELSRDLFCVLDSEGHVSRANHAATEILEYDREELERMNVIELIHPEDRDAAAQQLRRLSNETRAARFIIRTVSKSGTSRWTEWSVIRCRAENFLFAVARDITERRATEEEQRQAAVAQAKFFTLSPREQDVLKLVVEGHPNKAIAQRLELSEKTVERHRSRGMKKLKIASVPDLVRLAMLAEV